MKFKFKRKQKIKKEQRKQCDWDIHQLDIFKDSVSGIGNTIVEASPGSGKSTTIIECLFSDPSSNKETLALAFNNDIVNHLERYVPADVSVRTTHKLGFNTVLNNWGFSRSLNKTSVDSLGKIAEILAEKEVGPSDKALKLRKNLVRTMDLAKSTLSLSSADIEILLADQGIDTYGLSPTAFSSHVLNMIEKTKEPQLVDGQLKISFADMIWLPYVYDWTPEQYERIYVDEYQDLSKARFNLVSKALAPGGRMFVFGDNMQAIFQFAGANPQIGNEIKQALEAKRLNLSVSYRLPNSIIDLARKYNDNIQAAPNAKDGNINTISKNNIINYCKPGTAILSRTNFHIIDLVFSLLKNNIKANIRGRDIADRFLWRINCWEPRDVSGLEKSICSWRDQVCSILEEKRRPTHRIIDEAESLLRLARGAQTIDEVQKRIKLFFKDDPKNQIKLSTCHKAKGLEWNNVILLDETFKPDKNEEERCIYYVAITRAKENLIFAS